MTGECLSILELLDLRASGVEGAEEARNHVRTCPRCRGLLRTLPDMDIAEESSDAPEIKARPTAPKAGTDRPRAGQVWLASAPEVPDRRYVVVVIGRRRGPRNGILVAPTTTQLGAATDLDLLVDERPLGYEFTVSTWNFGTVLPGQLETYLGSLADEDLSHIKSLYRLVVADEQEGVDDGRVGPKTAGRDDERLIWRAEQIESLRPLWRPWRKLTAEERQPSPSGVLSLSGVLSSVFQKKEWDAVSLAEAAHVSTTDVDALLADRLDLTDQRDVESVASILHELGLKFEEIEAPLRETLNSSPGGLRLGTGGTERIAARTFADVTEEQRSKEIYEGLAKVDDSEEARRRAIESYLQEVAHQLDELGQL